MDNFIHHDFLLANPTGAALYHQVAATLPVVDYHNHINMHELTLNKQYDNLTQLWLAQDPYKHRLMRINGVAESYISGNKTDKEKFLKWAETISPAIGNPMFHWSALELKRVFQIDEILCPANAEEIWEHCNHLLASPGFRMQDLAKKWNAESLTTSDDFLDDLQYHGKLIDSACGIRAFPSLRADAALALNSADFPGWIQRLSAKSGFAVTDLESYQSALVERLDYFGQMGCFLSDHALDADFGFVLPPTKKAADLFNEVQNGNKLSAASLLLLQSYMLTFLSQQYALRGWAMQLHIGAQRRTSSRLRKLTGGTGGYAAVGKTVDLESICRFLDSLEEQGHLPRLILYASNPADNEVFSSLTGSFTGDGVAGKLQFGPPWWYNDHQEGIRSHLATLANYGMLGRFIGMTTDSRSILSLSRHEYFRRVFCDLLGEWVEKKLFPNDFPLLAGIVENICYQNSKVFFNLNEKYEKSITP